MADSIDPAAKLKTGDARDNKLGTVIGQVLPDLLPCYTSAVVDIERRHESATVLISRRSVIRVHLP